MADMNDWTVEVVSDPGVDGWIEVPRISNDQDIDEWVAATAEQVCGQIGVDVGSDAVLDVMSEIHFALAQRLELDPIVTFQIWPINRPVSLVCHLALKSGPYAPAPADVDFEVVAHPADSAHLGSGIQYTTRYRVPGEDASLVAVDLVFSDGENSVVIGLGGSAPELVGVVTPSFLALKDSIRVARAGGDEFVGELREEFRQEDAWTVEAGT